MTLFFSNFSSSNDCIQCHEKQFKNHRQSVHDKTFSKTLLDFQEGRSKEYAIKYMKSFHFSLGSGTRGKSFFLKHPKNNKFINAAIGFAAGKLVRGEGQKDEGMLEEYLGVEIDQACLYCHTGNLTETNQKPKLSKISCSSCHAMDKRHHSDPSQFTQIKSVGPQPQFDSCSSCHTNPNNSNDFVHANQARKLPLSKCYSDQMKCQSCHDPHSLKVSENSCTQCHSKNTSPHYQQEFTKCINCHMPKNEINMTLPTLQGGEATPKMRDHIIIKNIKENVKD